MPSEAVDLGERVTVHLTSGESQCKCHLLYFATMDGESLFGLAPESK